MYIYMYIYIPVLSAAPVRVLIFVPSPARVTHTRRAPSELLGDRRRGRSVRAAVNAAVKATARARAPKRSMQIMELKGALCA